MAENKLIRNPWPTADDTGRVQANLDEDVYNYFFRHVFAGDRGVKQAVINQTFKALYEECQRAGIPAEWSPENQQHVADILNRINFTAPRRRTNRQSPKRKQKP